MTIYKYPFAIQDEFVLPMPSGAQILKADSQRDVACIWALVDPSAPIVERRFALRGTGHDANGLEATLFVGTFQIYGGDLVFHLFERGAV